MLLNSAEGWKYTLCSHSRLSSYLTTSFALILTYSFTDASGIVGNFGPAFYPCNFQGSLEDAQGSLSMSINGNPSTYQPGSFYEVNLTGESSFNFLIVTGMINTHPGNGGPQCFPIHTHMTPNIVRSLTFFWFAPPAGSGCVSMIIRASSPPQIVYDDIMAFRICEEGMESDSTLDIHTSGVIFRDDFDSGSLTMRWNPEWMGIEQSAQCQIVRGNAAVFCDVTSSNRYLISKVIDMRNASSLQFALGSGDCQSTESKVQVSFRDISVTHSWTVLKHVRVKSSGKRRKNHVHVASIPSEAKSRDVEIKFSEEIPDSGSYSGCWGLDDVLITSEDHRSNHIEEHLDPIETSNWLFMHGATIEHQCSSNGDAFMMRNDEEATFVTTRDIDLSEGLPTGSIVDDIIQQGGRLDLGACGHQNDTVVHVFEEEGARSLCTGHDVDLSDKIAATFTLSIGSGDCHRRRSHRADLHYYYKINGEEHAIKAFHVDAYSTPKHTVVPIPGDAQAPGAIVCIRQDNQAMSKNVWAVDSFALVERVNELHYFAQFAINMGCDRSLSTPKVKLQYSTDQGRNWDLLQTECLPETCRGKHWAQNSVYGLTEKENGWHRETLSLPSAALAITTRFRWTQKYLNETTQWGLDDIYIGSDATCPNMCNGRGHCSFGGCRCDSGYSGSSCDVISMILPDFVSENFNNGDLDTTLFKTISGAEIGFACGILSSGRSLVFNGAERRMLITQPLNATSLKFVQFTILVGRNSHSGTCRPASSPGEGVLVQYSLDSGTNWHLLEHVSFKAYHEPRIFSLRLPSEAKVPGLQLRWFQATNHNGAGYAVWALDDVLVASQLFKTAYSPSVTFHLGAIQPYCNRSLVLAFTTHGPPHEHQVRYAETQTLQISQGYILQADIVIGCEDSHGTQTGTTALINVAREELNTTLQIEFSTNHGKTWQLVSELSIPGSTSTEMYYHPATIFYASEHEMWRRVMLPLPERTWSEATRFRIAQFTFDDRIDSWAVDKVYMGPGCPMQCRSHGTCSNGVCVCDVGHFGDTCMPIDPLPTGIDVQFDDIDVLQSRGWRVIGGHLVGTAEGAMGTGCDAMTSSTYLHFNQKGVRKLLTPNIDTSAGGQIQFYIQIGGGKCDLAKARANGVILQYSLDGGTMWLLLQELYYSDYPTPSYVHLDLPNGAKTPHTMFRWWQPKNRGKNFDRWSIDDVFIGQRMQSDEPVFDMNFLPPSVGLVARAQLTHFEKDFAFITFSNRGEEEDFCSPISNSYAFNKLSGDRFAITNDMFLSEGDTIQFQINVACSISFSFQYPVRLEYSHDGGYTWDYVRHACHPSGRALTRDDRMTHSPQDLTSHLCTGSVRELVEASRYHRGDYDVWKTVIIPVSAYIAAEPVRFRWFQNVPKDDVGDTPADWAIANIYIGPSCPDFCAGHGLCHNSNNGLGPTCTCDNDFEINEFGSCSAVNPNPSGFWDRFDGLESWWKRPLGGTIGAGCEVLSEGDSFYFGGEGTRRAETISLDTTHIRMIQFYLRIGSSTNSETCGRAHDRDESVIFQYSRDNGITWNLIKELSFETFGDSHVPLVTLAMPYMAKTPSTTFRWWQPLTEEAYSRAPWAVDDIMIGRADMLVNNFYENFEYSKRFARSTDNALRPSDEYWFKIKGGHVGEFEQCLDVDSLLSKGNSLVFSMEDQHRYAETWDFYLLSGSFLQFDLIMGCDTDSTNSNVIRLEYSSDLGKNWLPVLSPCLPASNIGCEYSLGTFYYHNLKRHWKRHTVMLTEVHRKPRIRFRWIQHYHLGSRWALDNVYLGNGCEWGCGGFGYCTPSSDQDQFACRCDDGFNASSHCQPNIRLPSSMKDNFNNPWITEENYGLVVGGRIFTAEEPSSIGTIIGEERLQFSQAGLRMLQTLPLNISDTRYLQFHLKYLGEDFGFDHTGMIIIQASLNNGITWHTLKVIECNSDDETQMIHIKLPRKLRYHAVVFRWWMNILNAVEDEFSWSLDNLVIGGRLSACEPHIFVEDYSEINGDNWLFHPGGSVGDFCQNEVHEEVISRFSEPLPPDIVESSEDFVINFSNQVGYHYLETRDLCVTNENYVIQFKIAMGCDDEMASSNHAVKLQYSVDDGVTWDLVVPHCHSDLVIGAGCIDELHPGSVYYPGAFKGWKRIVISLRDKDHICSSKSVRFRWYQGYYSAPVIDSVPWAIDEVYIGPQCKQMCNGHGVCTNDGETCICDDGYEGETCCDVVEGTNPTFLKETFDGDIFAMTAPNKLWSEAAGGNITSSHCDQSVLFSRNNYAMTKPGLRLLATRDLNTRRARFIQFYLKAGSEWDQYESHESIYLQYSTDGGLSWAVLQTLKPSHMGQAQYVALSIPENARSNSTRFRWWEPSSSGTFVHQWAVDHVIVAGDLQEIDDNFETIQDETWLELSSSEITSRTGSRCCASGVETCTFLHIGGSILSSSDCGRRWAATTGSRVSPGTFIQFKLIADCERNTKECHQIVLECSTDLGHTWTQVQSPCYPSNPLCAHTQAGSALTSDQFRDGGRVTIPLPEHVWSSSTRFRWLMLEEVNNMTWSIDDVYVGNACPSACSGHGICHNGTCECDNGWSDSRCQIPTYEIPTVLKDVFDDDNEEFYFSIVGAVRDDLCGDMGFKNALHFNGSCSRALTTKPLNTHEADFVQFKFRFGCSGAIPTNRDEGVLLDYSSNGGITWKNLMELYYSDYNDTRFVNMLLPGPAKGIGIQFRWWQPTHGIDGANDWAMDNLFIGGKKKETFLSDSFVLDQNVHTYATLYLDRDDIDMWQFYDNTRPGTFCGRSNVIVAGVESNVEASVQTKDFIAKPGYILQYTVVVLCQDVQKVHQPVHVQYSTDFGDTWRYVTSQCFVSDPDCFGREMSQPTAHFISPDWRRRTIWLPDDLLGRPIRFRLHQYNSDVSWALDRLYIGPACPDACSGHGDCVGSHEDRHCICDSGYSGPNCYLNFKQKNYVKDTFNAGPLLHQWNLLEAERNDNGCGQLIDGFSLRFAGVGPRQAETIDLDLRDARFVQYQAVIGHSSLPDTCLPAISRLDGIVLQYSINGGIAWQMLHELDYQSYTGSKQDYFNLPFDARTNSTRLRWWQPFTIDKDSGLAFMGADRAGWAIDNVYVGGHEVNAPVLQDDLEAADLPDHNLGALADESFEFYPNGVVDIGVCGGQAGSNIITWLGDNPETIENSLTTRQLIVSPGYMIQFKLKVGCTDVINECIRDFSVRMEYRKTPFDQWKLVREECFPDSLLTSACTPFVHHRASIYTPQRTWSRVTIPLDHIESGTAQFRWFQEGGAPTQYSWALDEIYIGEACPGYCSGHGRCISASTCICYPGYEGIDCSQPVHPTLIRDFKDHFELPTPIEGAMTAKAIARGAIIPKRWELIEGGEVRFGGCGSLRPFGFGRTAYFSRCGNRVLQTVEMDMHKGSHIQYVLQIGMSPPRLSCHVSFPSNMSRAASVLLEYTTDNGVTWHLLQEHRPELFSKPRRVAITFVHEMKTDHTILRWWQPRHNGNGQDQWAVDNIEIIMSRENRHMHNRHAPPPLLPSRQRVELPNLESSDDNIIRVPETP